MICPHCGMYVNLRGSQLLERLSSFVEELPQQDRAKVQSTLIAMASKCGDPSPPKTRFPR
jgi:hypothetical protein